MVIQITQSDGLNQDESLVSLGLITRKFNNPVLEQEYLSLRAEENINLMTMGVMVAFLALCTFAGIVYYAAGGENAVTNRLIFYITTPIPFLIFLIRKVFSGNLQKMEFVVAFTLIWAIANYNWSLANETPAASALIIGLGANIIFLVFSYFLLRLRFLVATISGTILVLTFIPAAYLINETIQLLDIIRFEEHFWGDPKDLFRSPFLYLVGIIVVTHPVCAVGSYALETSERHNFLAGKIITKQNKE